jgi:hypothetical protein
MFDPFFCDGGCAVELLFSRTELGDAELRRPVRDLPQSARELLFVIDRAFGLDQCVSKVHDAHLSDAMFLLSLGLIRTAFFDAGPVAPDRNQLQRLVAALLELSQDDLYTFLTQQAKRRLGLLQGFRMVLALERCNNHDEQCALAVRFVQEIWRIHGEAGLRPLQDLLTTWK